MCAIFCIHCIHCIHEFYLSHQNEAFRCSIVGPTPYLRPTSPGKRRLERWGISVSIVSAAQRRQAERVERAATLAGMQLSAQGRVTRLRVGKREFEWWSNCKMMVGSLTDCRVISCKIDENWSNGLKLTQKKTIWELWYFVQMNQIQRSQGATAMLVIFQGSKGGEIWGLRWISDSAEMRHTWCGCSLP